MIAGRRWNADGGGHGWIWREIVGVNRAFEKSRRPSPRVLEITGGMRRVEVEANAAILTPR